jgi:hypothetical protein
MPARIVSLCMVIATFFGLRKHEPDVDQLLVNAANKSHKAWMERGWVNRPH